MSEVIYQKVPDDKELKKYERKARKEIEQRGLQSFYETVRDNENLFDREYYIKVLEEKGFKF